MHTNTSNTLMNTCLCTQTYVQCRHWHVDTSTQVYTLINIIHSWTQEQCRLVTYMCMATNTCPYKNILGWALEDLPGGTG